MAYLSDDAKRMLADASEKNHRLILWIIGLSVALVVSIGTMAAIIAFQPPVRIEGLAIIKAAADNAAGYAQQAASAAQAARGAAIEARIACASQGGRSAPLPAPVSPDGAFEKDQSRIPVEDHHVTIKKSRRKRRK